MKYGFVLPYGEARAAAELACTAEGAGWDGFFVWEPVWGIDAWISLAAAAMQTERIRLGTMLTPPSRMRPWKLASETATLDRLSGGRVILSVGLGAIDTGFETFHEETDRKIRAELLDESLEILTGLWSGDQDFSFQGKHYQVSPSSFYPPPPPIQQPRIPIWVVGAYPHPKSMRRALRYDGLLPTYLPRSGEHVPLTPEVLREICSYVEEHREAEGPYDIVVEGTTPGNDPEEAAKQASEWAEAGATWWIEAMWDQLDAMARGENETVVARLRQGPPRTKRGKND